MHQPAAMSKSIALVAVSLTLVGSCADPTPEGARQGNAPLLGAADGSDSADHACQLVLRELARPTVPGGFATECIDGYCWFVWEGTVDVASAAIDQGGYPELIYQSGSDSTWWLAEGTPEDGAPAGFQRFGFHFSQHTVSPGMSLTALMQTRIQVAPYLVTPSGGRLFDHNRNPGDFDNYFLTSDNSWTIDDDPAVCQPASSLVALQSAQVVTRIEYPNLMHSTLEGVVRVVELGGESSVVVHYQARDHRDDPATVPWATVAATPIGDGLWEFETPALDGECPHYCPRQLFQFAISYEVGGNTYWDNNGGPGIDYVLANDIGGSVPIYFGPPAILDTPVQLSYADWDGEFHQLTGQILVDNLAYDKSLALVYSTDGWATVKEAPAQFDRMTYDDLEYWRFRVDVAEPGADLRFAIRYTVGGDTYWDNNFERNYQIATP